MLHKKEYNFIAKAIKMANAEAINPIDFFDSLKNCFP